MEPPTGVKQLMFLLLMAVVTIGSTHKSDQAPNIIIVVADDLGWDDISFHGSQQIPTPNIDALAYSGTILNNYYVHSLCTPSRSALMTGRYPIHTGLQHSVIVGAQPYGLGLNETLLPEYLRNMGYATYGVGKWHLGFFAKEYTPTFRGFNKFYGYWQGAGDYWDHTYLHVYDEKNYVGLDFHEDMRTVRSENGSYSTELFTQSAQDIINNHDTSQPLFLYLAHQAVHSAEGGNGPLQAPEKYVQMFSHIEDKNRRIFAAMTYVMDQSVGNLTRTLHEKGILNNTILIFTTDNGGPAFGYNSNWACNLPLRGRKGSIWEGGTRGAAFIWSPLLKSSSVVSNQLMHVSDWLPTILAAAGYNTSSLPGDLDGMNMWDAINNPTAESPRKELLYNIDPVYGTYAIRMNNYKLIREIYSKPWYSCPGIPQPSYRTGSLEKPERGYLKKGQTAGGDGVVHMDQLLKHNERMKGIDNTGQAPEHLLYSSLYPIFSELGLSVENTEPIVVDCGPKPANASTNCNPNIAPCLYDISSDPCEYHNLASMHPDIVQQLLERVKVHNATAVPPKNVPDDPNGLPIYHHDAWEVWINL